MDRYLFTLAKPEDIPKILEFYRSLIGSPGCTWHLDYPNVEIIRQDIENESLYLLKDGNDIISATAAVISDELQELKWISKNPCDLARLGVLSSKLGQGIGTLMIKNVIITAKKRGFDGIRLIVSKNNQAAIMLYDKTGFVRCGETNMYNIEFYCYEMIF